MDKQQLILQWINQEFQKPEDANQYIIGFLAEHAADIPEFQAWLKAEEAKLKASMTPEALEAQKLANQQEIQRRLAAVKGVGQGDK